MYAKKLNLITLKHGSDAFTPYDQERDWAFSIAPGLTWDFLEINHTPQQQSVNNITK